MQNSPVMKVPFPEPTDHTRTWEHWQAIATRIDQIYGVELPGGVDLNTMLDPGQYSQSQSADAVSGLNYPVNPDYAAPIAGLLTVSKNGGHDSSEIYQRYTEYHPTKGYEWLRTYYAADGGWGPWRCTAGSANWVNCTLKPGFAAVNGAPQVRLLPGDDVIMRGTLDSTKGFSGTTFVTPFTIPAPFRPTGDWVYTACVGNSGSGTAHTCVVKTTGDFEIRPASIPTSSFQLFLPRWSRI